ncbi:MAG: hypothetical protein HKN33_19190 [Pyrinomonadaceae bacterium]|nr:hypothetical protein [Pyrinomonadaceae bacterium]
MKQFKGSKYLVAGLLLGAVMVGLAPVSARVSEEVTRVFVTNSSGDPVPIEVKETLEIKGKVKIDGEPEVKLNGNSRIEAINDPVRVRFERDGVSPASAIFEDGKRYLIGFGLDNYRRCRVDRIRGNWILCKQEPAESVISGWVNASNLITAIEMEK